MVVQRPMSDDRDDIDDLRQTVQDLRAGKYPDLPADLVDEVLAAERQNADDRSEARRAVRQAVTRHVAVDAQRGER